MKRIFSMFMAFMIVLTLVPSTSFGQGGLFITSPKTINAISGDSIRIPITIENFSYDYYDNLLVMLEIENPEYVYLPDSASKKISIDEDDDARVRFDLEIDDLAPRGTYKVDVTLVDGDYGDILQRETIYIRVTSNPAGLNISRLDILPDKTVHPGQKFNIGIELENLGDVLAENISVTLKGLSEDGISLANGSSTQRIQSIPGGYKNYAAYQLEASNSLKQGNYPLELEIKYNGNITEIHDININVQVDPDAKSNLIFEDLTFPSGTIGQNKEVNIDFNLRNQGQTEAKNILINAKSLEINGLVPKSLSQFKISSILPGEAIPVSFQFLTTNNSETRNYPVELIVEYEDELSPPNERYSINQFVGVFVDSADSNQSKPKLIIDKYNFEPSLVEAGSNFTMNLSFFNTNSSKAVKNIKIFLTSDERTDSDSNSAGGSVFTPVDSSNTFYIDNIPPKGRVEKKITMFTVPDAKAKTYTLTANFEYEDSKAEEYTATELIGVPVVQQSKLDVGEVNVYPEAYVGQSTPVSLEFYNTGKVTLYNMMVKIEGDFQTENGQYYVGNFQSGNSEYFEGYVIPSDVGELTGEVVFTYEDSTGQNQEIRKDFTLNVMEMMMPEFPDGMPYEEFPEEGGSSAPKIIGAIVAAIAIAAGVIIYKKRKKKQLEALEIDE